MSIYTGRTKDEAMINAMMGVCKPCCYGGGSDRHDLLCCPGVTAHNICATLTGGSAFDGTYTLTYSPTGYLNITDAGWYTERMPGPCANDLFPYPNEYFWAFGPSNCSLRFYEWDGTTFIGSDPQSFPNINNSQFTYTRICDPFLIVCTNKSLWTNACTVPFPITVTTTAVITLC